MQSILNLKGTYGLVLIILLILALFLPHYSEFQSILQFQYSPLFHMFPELGGALNFLHPSVKLFLSASILYIVVNQIQLILGIFLEQQRFNNIESFILIGLGSIFLSAQIISAELLVLPIIFVILIKCLRIDEDHSNTKLLFDTGILIGIASLIFLPIIVLLFLPILSTVIKRISSGKSVLIVLVGFLSISIIFFCAAILLDKVPDYLVAYEKLSSGFLYFPQFKFLSTIELSILGTFLVIGIAGCILSFSKESILRVIQNKLSLLVFGLISIPLTLFGPDILVTFVCFLPFLSIFNGQFIRYFPAFWRNIMFFALFGLILYYNYHKFLIG